MKLGGIAVPYMVGDPQHGASRGTVRLAAAAGLAARQVAVAVPEGSPSERSLTVNRALAPLVREVAAAGDVPLVLAGTCDSCLGVLAGLPRRRALGVVWIDAHGDFNTPETSASGFIPGMCLAAAVGHCAGAAWAALVDGGAIPEEHVLLYGTRDLDPPERVRLERSAVSVVEWRNGRPQRDLRAPLEALAARVDAVYLHIDLDGLDPEVAPGTYERPAPGGLRLDEVDVILDTLRARVPLAGATIATYDVDRDVGDRTLRAALHIIERLGA